MADAKKIKKDAADFQAKYGMKGPEGFAPEEQGADDSLEELVPDTSSEMAKNGWLSGALPTGPAAAEGVAAKTGSIISKLRQAGMDEGALAKAAEEIRLAGSTRFVGPGGKVVADVGAGSPLGQELAAYGKTAKAAEEARAPGFIYRKIGKAGP